MRIVVGKYELNTTEQFNSKEEVIEHFLGIFPDATKTDVEKQVNLVYGKENQSRNILVEDSESATGNTEDGPGKFGKKQVRKNQH